MLNWLKRFFRAQPARPAVTDALRLIHSRYDAAVTSDANRRHWEGADNLSANAANSPEVRRILRTRSRYEIANNSYARGIVLTLAVTICRLVAASTSTVTRCPLITVPWPELD